MDKYEECSLLTTASPSPGALRSSDTAVLNHSMGHTGEEPRLRATRRGLVQGSQVGNGGNCKGFVDHELMGHLQSALHWTKLLSRFLDHT